MKKTNLYLIMAVSALLLYSASGNAKIWRVNYGSNYNGTTTWGSNFGGNPAFPVFNTINQAVAWASVVDGDTLHIEGSQFIYGAGTITKRLVIIGPGFYLGDNPKTSNDLYSAKITRINFQAGSGGSTAIGLNIVVNTNTADGYFQIADDSITIKRCRIERAIYFHITGGSGIQLVTILQNYFPDGFNITTALSVSNTGFVPPVDLIFNNNICKKTLLWYNSSGPWAITQCKNNIFDGPDNLATPNLRFTTTDFSNNILMPVNAIVDITAAPSAIAYNIGTQSTQFGTANNNLVEPNITSLFAGGTSNDGYYQIQSGSQAYQNGSDGTDRGAFGGAIVSSRYTLSGLAPVPVVYEATTTSVVSAITGLPVTIKARTIK
ncbi:MAG TPA: hypothetical protein VJY62_15225 [Bacteroidia bacterium]|nr:hypothetical protein [Bacteroidia bacterium]